MNFELYFFNESTIKILKCLENNFNINMIISSFKKEFDVKSSQLEKDISSTILFLEKNNFVKKEGEK